MKTNERVLHVQPGAIITVHTSKATYKARSVVLTVGISNIIRVCAKSAFFMLLPSAGAWASELVKSLGIELPLQVRIS